MKSKKMRAFVLVLTVCFMCNVPAFAAESTEAQTKVTYTKTVEEAPEPSTPAVKPQPPSEDETSPAPSKPVYEIAIPSEFSLNTSNVLPVYLAENNLSEGQTLAVCIDANRTMSNDGYLYLQGTQSQTPAKVAIGYYTNTDYVQYIGASGFYQVASFEAGDVHPVLYGTLLFELQNEQELVADTYTGTIFFSLSVSEE